MGKILFFVVVSALCSYNTIFSEITFSTNRYNDVVALVTGAKQSVQAFKEELTQALRTWNDAGYKAVWFTIPAHYAEYIPAALQEKFMYHHTTSQELVMIREIQEGAARYLPPYATQGMGTFCLVIDNDNNILVVKERFQPELGYKFPGGRADFSEKIGDTAVREVQEETGIDSEFLGIVAWRHRRGTQPEQISDISFCCLLRPTSHTIAIQESEIADACWMHYNAFKEIATGNLQSF